MPAQKPIRTRKDWYSISVDTLRGWALLLLILIGAGVGYYVYEIWHRQNLEHQSAALIEEVKGLFLRLDKDAKVSTYRSEVEVARQSFEQSQAAFQRRDFGAALAEARRSHGVLLSVLDQLAMPGTAGQGQFLSIQGEVEFRRGEGGSWEEARSRVPLHAGDFVRTSEGGSAEIMFLDGTLYTVRANTQFIVSPGGSGGGAGAGQSIQMEYGWVDLNTASRSSQVKTPGAVAHVRQDSEAFVAYDKDGSRGRFGAFRGGLELVAKGGLTREVKEMQQVRQTGDLLSDPEKLPGRPDLLEPADNLELDLGRNQSLVLAWSPVPSASRYALQVSRNHLFVDNYISVENRVKTRATLGLRGEGTFYWRIAALGKDGFAGPWSKPLKFRVASFRGGDSEKNAAPPELDLEDVKSYGNIFIVGGHSDPGSRVEVNGELVNVGIDGSFTKTVQLTKEGWSFIEVRARDSRGTQTVKRRRVFVESP
ncbi:MAG: FecR family protein [Acidobacteriota bacterium]|nr:FecR family protein [Acidobacteriota bacterium]